MYLSKFWQDFAVHCVVGDAADDVDMDFAVHWVVGDVVVNGVSKVSQHLCSEQRVVVSV